MAELVKTECTECGVLAEINWAGELFSHDSVPSLHNQMDYVGLHLQIYTQHVNLQVRVI